MHFKNCVFIKNQLKITEKLISNPHQTAFTERFDQIYSITRTEAKHIPCQIHPQYFRLGAEGSGDFESSILSKYGVSHCKVKRD